VKPAVELWLEPPLAFVQPAQSAERRREHGLVPRRRTIFTRPLRGRSPKQAAATAMGGSPASSASRPRTGSCPVCRTPSVNNALRRPGVSAGQLKKYVGLVVRRRPASRSAPPAATARKPTARP
jgi:hypothetical protein